jgi:hypothetical protein
MTDSLAIKLANFPSKGYVIAPAGYGKTHLISRAVKESKHRQLILTHTYAGVNSIKKKMAENEVSSKKYQIDTIASWALRVCLAYPMTSGWSIENPDRKEWNDLYSACQNILSKKFLRKILLSSYAGVYVDEYQDCSKIQHALICKLAEILPCRILGDPLQAIFDFDEPVDWKSDIYPHFESLGTLDTPWRWKKNGSDELGDWLKEVRNLLSDGKSLDLSGVTPKGVSTLPVDLDNFKDRNRLNVFYRFLEDDDTVIAMHGGAPELKNKTHKLAQSLAGKFSSIEEIEGRDLISFIKKMESESISSKRFLLAIEFAKKCFTGLPSALPESIKQGKPAKPTPRTKNLVLLMIANKCIADPSSGLLKEFFLELKRCSGIQIYRRDLLNRFVNVLKIHIDGRAPTLLEAAYLYQSEFRHSGRPLRHPKLIGTTLLVKGLEFDHAVILDAASLSAKELYVAMTRGTKSLTILTRKSQLPTEDDFATNSVSAIPAIRG